MIIEPRSEKTGLWGFRPGLTQTRLYSHWRWLEAWQEAYYLCSENKDTDKLRGDREADLRLCFRISKSLVIS